MAGGDLLMDRLVAGGFLRPAVLLRGLQLRRPALSCWSVSLAMGLSGLVVEPLAWFQSWLFARRLQTAELPDDPIVVIGHWRSGTTYLHQLLACAPLWPRRVTRSPLRRRWPCCSNPGFAGHSKPG